MKPLRVQIDLSPEQLEAREKLKEAVLKNPLTQRFLSRHPEAEAIVAANPAQFRQILERQEKCLSCKGLDFCVQPIRGQVVQPELDQSGSIVEIFCPCKFARQERDEYRYTDNYRFFHGSREDQKILLENFSLQGESQEYTQAYIAVTQSTMNGRGLFLWGKPGSGKTYLLRAAANAFCKQGKEVSFVNMPLLVQALKENLKDDVFRQARMADLMHSDVLFLDDIGSESITRWTRNEILFPVLEYRMNHKLATYFSSNYKADELEKHYVIPSEAMSAVEAKRLLERVLALAAPVKVAGESRRHKGQIRPEDVS